MILEKKDEKKKTRTVSLIESEGGHGEDKRRSSVL
jgi:hypothetical protein